jgi:hypothetical protein
VRESLGDIEHPAVGGGQVGREVRREGGRVLAQVDDDVVDRPSGAANQLGLLIGRGLPVHAAQCAPAQIQRDVALCEVGVQSMGLELAAAERAGKEAALVADRFQTDQECTLQRGLREDHAHPSIIARWSWSVTGPAGRVSSSTACSPARQASSTRSALQCALI